ncbi:MAG: hypothetical protein PCFJNLEI_02022 [Verrucomicrobiae bacterium]|nr:hypothetical protein [Verrucomicrobiae bacterium]
MKLSFATLGCPNWTLEQIITNAKTLGYDGVELRGVNNEHVGLAEPPEGRQRIRQLFASAGIEICSLMGYTTFTNDEEAKQQANIEAALQYVDLARDLGCPRLRVFGGNWSPQTDCTGNIDRVVACLKQIAPRAEQHGVQLCLETHDAWTRGANLRAVLDGVGSPAIGACWDVANSFSVEPLEQTFGVIRDRLFHVHLKDTRRVAGKIRNVLPGEGEVDWEGALRLLHGGGYRDYLSFEWEKKWEPELAEPEVVFPLFHRRCRELLRKVGASVR